MAEVIGFPQMSDLASNGGITIGQMAGQAKATAAPTYEQQMGTTLNLANMMDQRRQALMTKGILGQQGAMDEQGNLTPAGRTSLAGVNPETMGTIENAAAMRAYRENMGQAAENRATAMMNTAKVKQDQLNFKERTQQQLDDNSTFANLLVKATPETAAAVIDTFSKLHQGNFHSPGDIATWNTILGRKPIMDANGQPIMDANGQPTGYEQGPVDPQKLQALQTGVVSAANSFQQATLDRIKQSGVDQNEYKLQEIQKPAELEKERADRAKEALRLKAEQDKAAKAPKQQEKDDEKTALTLAQHINSLTATSRTLLGVAATNNMKSDRALLLLQDPDIDVTQKDAAVTDFLSVMKQGSPDEQQLKKGMYGSLYEKGLELAQSVTGQPMQYKDTAVIDKLVKMFEGFKSIDNNVVDDNLGVYAAAAKGFISRNPEQWNKMAEAVKSSYTGPGKAQKRPGGTAPVAGPGKAPGAVDPNNPLGINLK
jgi:hypothetical protein